MCLHRSTRKYLQEQCPTAFVESPLADFVGMRLAIDSSEFMYANTATCLQELTKTSLEVNRDVLVRALVVRVLRYTAHLLRQGIEVVWVRDGKAPEEKAAVLEQRRDERQNRDAALVVLIDHEMAKDVFDRDPSIHNLMRQKLSQQNKLSYTESARIFSLVAEFGVPVFQAPGEADPCCAGLCLAGWAHAVVSSDSDFFALGPPIVITELKPYQGLKGLVSWNAPQEIYRQLGLSQGAFIDAAICSGTDYNPNLERISFKAAYELMLKHQVRSIEQLAPIKPNLAWDSLNHSAVRRLFQVQAYGSESDCVYRVECLSSASTLELARTHQLIAELDLLVAATHRYRPIERLPREACQV